MKTFAKKIVIFTLISIAINTALFIFPQNQAKAAVDFEALNTELRRLADDGDNKCISSDEKKKYIVTMIEEPLLWDQTDAPSGEYITRTCYRNIIDLTRVNQPDGKPGEITTYLAKSCSSTLANTQKQDSNVRYTCEEIMVILHQGGTSLITGYVSTLYIWGASIAGLIAVVVVIISGIQLSASGGDSQAVESSKNRIIKSLTAIAVLFLSALILYTINPTFFTK